MRTRILFLSLLLSTAIFAQSADQPAKQPAGKNSTVNTEDPSMPRVRELEKVFNEFLTLLHGQDVDKSRKYLSDGVLAQVSTENLQALSKSIRADRKIIVISEKIEYDLNRSGLETVTFKYEEEPYPYETFQVCFDKTNKIAFLNSNRPTKKDMVTAPENK